MSAPTAEDLATIALFHDLGPTDRDLVASWLETESYDAGHVFTHQGAAGYAFYIIKDGDASFSIDGNEAGSLGPGDFFGEMSIIYDGRRTGTVTAISRMTVWSMFGTRFRQLQMEEPAVASVIEAMARERHHRLEPIDEHSVS
jgi:CRP-like cAMP-binding protein